jgi:hypothetical protein
MAGSKVKALEPRTEAQRRRSCSTPARNACRSAADGSATERAAGDAPLRAAGRGAAAAVDCRPAWTGHQTGRSDRWRVEDSPGYELRNARARATDQPREG